MAEANAEKAAQGGTVTHAQVEVADRASVKKMIAHTVDIFGKLDVKSNNAGVNRPMTFLDVTYDNWNSLWASMVWAA